MTLMYRGFIVYEEVPPCAFPSFWCWQDDNDEECHGIGGATYEDACAAIDEVIEERNWK